MHLLILIAFVAPVESFAVGLICLRIRAFLYHLKCSCDCVGVHDAISTIIAHMVPRHVSMSNGHLLCGKLPFFGPPSSIAISSLPWLSNLMQAAHDCDSVVTSRQLEELRIYFQISLEVILSIYGCEDYPYHTFYRGFYLSIDALETRLCLPPPLVAAAFLVQGPSNYYLSPRTGFKIKGAISYGKGWRSHFFFVDKGEDWGFPVVWAAHTMDNALPLHSADETEALGKIRALFSSGAIEPKKEAHLVETTPPPSPSELSTSKRPSWARGSSHDPSTGTPGGLGLFEGDLKPLAKILPSSRFSEEDTSILS
ncbi:hypothetical protein BHE74_00025854 [Ensete ventricosum]|nr:hypothetical protein BHE74_00025854 [Ensete ventricosum]